MTTERLRVAERAHAESPTAGTLEALEHAQLRAGTVTRADLLTRLKVALLKRYDVIFEQSIATNFERYVTSLPLAIRDGATPLHELTCGRCLLAALPPRRPHSDDPTPCPFRFDDYNTNGDCLWEK